MTNDSLKDREIPKLSSVIPVTGHSAIDHQARVHMNLTMEEYALVDMMEKYHKASKPLCSTEIYKCIGIAAEESQPLITRLWAKGFIETCSAKSRFKPTQRWYDGFPDLKKEFEEFWKSVDIPTVNGVKHISWTGAKPSAEKCFEKVRKLESFDYLIAQKIAYFRMIASSSYRKVMGGPVFLNITEKRYSEDWVKSIEKGVLIERQKPDVSKPETKITKEEVRKQF